MDEREASIKIAYEFSRSNDRGIEAVSRLIAEAKAEALRESYKKSKYWLDELTKLINDLYKSIKDRPDPGVLMSLRITDTQLRAAILADKSPAAEKVEGLGVDVYYISKGDILYDPKSKKIVEYNGTEEGVPRYGYLVLMRRAEVERRIREGE